MQNTMLEQSFSPTFGGEKTSSVLKRSDMVQNGVNAPILWCCFVATRVSVMQSQHTHLDASRISVALTLMPCPASKLVSLPTTTTPPFIVPKAGRQRRVTAEEGVGRLTERSCVRCQQHDRGATRPLNLQGLLGISMPGHKPSFRSCGGL